MAGRPARPLLRAEWAARWIDTPVAAAAARLCDHSGREYLYDPSVGGATAPSSRLRAIVGVVGVVWASWGVAGVVGARRSVSCSGILQTALNLSRGRRDVTPAGYCQA